MSTPRGKTVSEPVAIPEEPGKGNYQTLRMDTSTYRYVTVEDKIPGLKGSNTRNVAYYRTLGYRPVPIQSRDECDVDLLYPAHTVVDHAGNTIEIPERREFLHPGYTLMAIEVEKYNSIQEKLDRRNNPEPVDPGDVPLSALKSPNGVVARENERVSLTNLEEHISSEQDVKRHEQDVKASRKRVADRAPGFEQEAIRQAEEDARLAD